MNKKINLSFVNNNAIDEVPSAVEYVYSGKDYVSYGEDNNFPSILLQCYEESTILNSIINACHDYSCGNGFVNKDEEDIIINKKGMTLFELTNLMVLDYLIYGAVALNILKDSYGKISEIYILSPQDIRIDENEEYAYYTKKWGKYTKNVKKYPLFVPNKKEDTNSVFYYKSSKSRNIYGRPLWASALKDVLTSCEVTNFHLNAIRNNFSPSAIISFNQGQPDEETQRKIEDLLNSKFSGTNNASKMILTWSDSQDTAPTIQRLNSDDFDQRYLALSDSVQNNILSAFRCSPQLVGLNTKVSTAFNSVEFQDAFSLFKATVIFPIQKNINKIWKKLNYQYEPILAERIINFGNNEVK